jgi:hypothetical protein
MALALGVAAMFFGVVFIIVGWKGGGPQHMEGNLVGMIKGEYLPLDNPGQTSAFDTAGTASTGGTHKPKKK